MSYFFFSLVLHCSNAASQSEPAIKQNTVLLFQSQRKRFKAMTGWASDWVNEWRSSQFVCKRTEDTKSCFSFNVFPLRLAIALSVTRGILSRIPSLGPKTKLCQGVKRNFPTCKWFKDTGVTHCFPFRSSGNNVYSSGKTGCSPGTRSHYLFQNGPISLPLIGLWPPPLPSVIVIWNVKTPFESFSPLNSHD